MQPRFQNAFVLVSAPTAVAARVDWLESAVRLSTDSGLRVADF